MSTKYTKELLTKAVSNSESFSGVLRYLKLKQAGGTQTHITKQIKKLGVDTSHFTGQGHNKGKVSNRRKLADEVLVLRPVGSNRESVVRLRRAMLESGLTFVCVCGIVDEWQGKPIVLEIDHIDGNWLNNVVSNLRFMCPNCHSQEKDSNMPHKYRIK